MGSFFFAFFGLIFLCIVLDSENKAKHEHDKRVSEMEKRGNNWFNRVNNGPLNNREFHEKIMQEFGFRDELFEECNEILNSIPEMGGIQLKSNYDSNSLNIMEMIYNAKTGDVSIMWFSGYIKIHDLIKGFSEKPSVQACSAFIKWYQSELRRNGYTDATIVGIQSNGTVLGWRFTDGITSYDEIKTELRITD